MKTVLQILLIASLLTLGVIQVLYATGFFAKSDLIRVCPVDAISMQNGKAVIDPGKCIGCRRCVIGVPAPKNQTPELPKAAAPTVRDTVTVTNQKDPAVPDAATVQVKPLPVSLPPQAPQSKKLTYTVDPATCIGCTLCVQNCPAQAITMVGENAVIDNSKCIQCDVCVSGDKADFAGCPVQAISKR